MKKYGLLIIPLLLFTLLMGCKELFMFNLFTGMQLPLEVPNPDELVSELGESGAIQYYGEQMESDAFIEALEDDPDAMAAVEEFLSSVFMDEGGNVLPPPTEDPEALNDYQQAIVLYTQINMETTGGDELANNVFTMITEMTSGDGGATEEDLQAQISSLIPEEVETIDDFRIMVEGLLDANVAYEALGNSLEDTNNDGDITPDEFSDNLVMGEIVQNAASAALIDIAIQVLDDPNDPNDDPVAELYDWLTNPDTEVVIAPESIGDPLTILDENAGLMNLLDASGLDSLIPQDTEGI